MPKLLPDRLAGELAYRNAVKHPEHEQIDPCGETWVDVPGGALELTAERYGAAPLHLDGFREGEALPHGGTVLKEIPGMGKVCDWRSSKWTPVNGGEISPLVMVQHIPVIPNTEGIGDFVQLRNVLVVQGLMVQAATDREGNVALFTPFDSLCYQAAGANQQSCGVENMHATITEAWTPAQLRSIAWLCQLAQRKHHIAVGKGRLANGPGIVKVRRRGQVTHQQVSDAAGFHNRTDPGAKLWQRWDYVEHCVRFFDDHGHMRGA